MPAQQSICRGRKDIEGAGSGRPDCRVDMSRCRAWPQKRACTCLMPSCRTGIRPRSTAGAASPVFKPSSVPATLLPTGHRAAFFNVTERDAALAQIVGRQFQCDLVAGQDADVMLAHLARGIGDQLVAVIQIDPETRVGQDFGNHAIHFKQFFFSHVVFPCSHSRPRKRRGHGEASARQRAHRVVVGSLERGLPASLSCRYRRDAGGKADTCLRRSSSVAGAVKVGLEQSAGWRGVRLRLGDVGGRRCCVRARMFSGKLTLYPIRPLRAWHCLSPALAAMADPCQAGWPNGRCGGQTKPVAATGTGQRIEKENHGSCSSRLIHPACRAFIGPR
jgi:hypothetical protein